MLAALLFCLGSADAARSNNTISGRAILVDGNPLLVRGVAYSPVPIGVRPKAGLAAAGLDFYTSEFAAIYERDLPRMATIGVNTIRIYAVSEASHEGFLDECLRFNISVVGAFGLDRSEYDLSDPLQVLEAELALRRQLQALTVEPCATPGSCVHPAVTMWLIGNELNYPQAGFICDNGDCQFDGTQLAQLFQAVDRLCGAVRSFGLLCSTPLADEPLPASYDAAAHVSGEGATRWFSTLDPLMENVDLWTVNLYRPGGFGDWFHAYESRSPKPVVISEYGVDAFDSSNRTDGEDAEEDAECARPPCRVMREDGAAQGAMLQRLTEQLERNAITCIHNCESQIASGGIVFEWSDEWYKGEGADSNGPSGTMWYHEADALEYGRCPDWDPWLHSPCGFAMQNGLDDFFNEEWFGLFSISPGCPPPPPSVSSSLPPSPPPPTFGSSSVDQLTPRDGFFVLGTLWALGGCSVQSVAPARAEAADYASRYDGYPGCTARMLLYRAEGRLAWPHNTDCDYQAYARRVDGEAMCPPLPSHFTIDDPADGWVSRAVAAALLRLPPSPPCEVAVTASEERLARFECDRALGAPRLQRVPGTYYLLLDCTPWLMRGISYSPVPYSHDPSYAEPYGDYFTDAYAELFGRDLALFEAMGANTARLYAWRQSARHSAFLDECMSRAIVVIAVYEMGTAEDTPVGTPQERALLRARLQARLRVSRHPAIVAWLVGNELNGAWNEYACNAEYAKLFLHAPCTFGDSAISLCALVDSLCEVVHSEGGTLCSTPLAGVNVPDRYMGPWDNKYGLQGWVQVCEGAVHSTGEDYAGVQHVDFWAANLYPGKNFDAFNFSTFAQVMCDDHLAWRSI